jgi:Rhs element Vgr protein
MADSPVIGAEGVVKLSIYSDGSLIPGTVGIVSVSVKKAVNKIPYAKIIALDGDMPNKAFPVADADHFKPGTPIKISAGYGDEETPIFEGVVVALGIEVQDTVSHLIVECRDKAVAMTIGRKNANYVDVKDSDVITKLIGNHAGLSSDVGSTDTQYKELVQYYSTDWDFMLSRAEANGLLVIVDAAKVAVKAPATDGSPKLKVTYGDDLIEFHASTDARSQLSKVKGVAWDLKSQAIVEQEAAPQTLNSQGNLDSATLAKVTGPDVYRLQTPVPLESAALQSWVKARQVKAALARIQGRMRFQGSAKAKIGEMIALDGVGARFNGDVFVSTVTHTIAEGNWTTEVEFGMSQDWFAENRDLTAPPASGLVPGIEGLHVGVVKKLDADPEEQYKVQVSIPMLQAETDGVWARLCKPYASEGFGYFFIPEIGDEVVLGYFNNDPSSPVILGGLYSSKRKPAYELTSDNYKKAIVTKTKLTLEFDDEKKIVTITTPASNKIVISDDDKSILLQDQTGNKVKLSEDGILLDTPKDVSIKAQGKISLSATGNVEVNSNGDATVGATNISLSAKAAFTGKGNSTAELSASGQTTVKGAMVMIN